METIAKIAADPDYRLHIENRGGSYRVRYLLRQRGANRLTLTIPCDIVPQVKRIIRQSRKRHAFMMKARRIAEAMQRQEERRILKPYLNSLLEKILAASPCGRVVRERIKQGFKRAAALGLDALEAYVALRPWEYRGEKSGRPLKLG